MIPTVCTDIMRIIENNMIHLSDPRLGIRKKKNYWKIIAAVRLTSIEICAQMKCHDMELDTNSLVTVENVQFLVSS